MKNPDSPHGMTLWDFLSKLLANPRMVRITILVSGIAGLLAWAGGHLAAAPGTEVSLFGGLIRYQKSQSPSVGPPAKSVSPQVEPVGPQVDSVMAESSIEQLRTLSKVVTMNPGLTAEQARFALIMLGADGAKLPTTLPMLKPLLLARLRSINSLNTVEKKAEEIKRVSDVFRQVGILP